jgi:hypothetical protein
MNSIETDPIWIALDLKPSLCGEKNSKYVQMKMDIYYSEYRLYALKPWVGC